MFQILLHALHSTLHTLHFIFHTSHLTLHTSHTTRYTLDSTLYIPHYTLYTLRSALYSLHFTLSTLHSALHILHVPLHTPHSTLLSFNFSLHAPHFPLHSQSTVHWYCSRGEVYKTVTTVCFPQMLYVTAFGFVVSILFVAFRLGLGRYLCFKYRRHRWFLLRSVRAKLSLLQLLS